ncbi:MAG: hypothetical protein IT580_03355 [Verrucomicrobiales bacterium]|nr:hypothetical protein [Verrucomicrobiales bacterium]
MSPVLRRWLLVGVLAVLLVLGLGWGLTWGRGPWFRGRPLAYWFPSSAHSEGDWRETRGAELIEGGTEALPLFLAVLQEEDAKLDLSADATMKRVLSTLSDWLPARVRSEDRRNTAWSVLSEWQAASADNLRALTNAIDALPTRIQRNLCFALGYTRHPWEIVEPLLLRWVVQERGTPLSMAASAALVNGPSNRVSQLLPEVLATVVAVPDSTWQSEGSYEERILFRGLARYPKQLTPLIPWLEARLAQGTPRERARAALMLPFVDSARFPVRAMVEGHVGEMGKAGLRELLLGLRQFTGAEDRATRVQFVEVLAPLLLDRGRLHALDARWNASEVREIRYGAVTGGIAEPSDYMALLRDLGGDARPAVPWVVPWLEDSHAPSVLRAVLLLGRIGPQAPESIPALIRALTNQVAVAPAVVLLAAYGAEGRTALPVLDQLATGTWRFQGPPALDLFTRGDVQAWGFPDPLDMRRFRATGWVASEVRFHSNLVHSLQLPDRVWPPAAVTDAEGRVSLADLARHAIQCIQSPEP